VISGGGQQEKTKRATRKAPISIRSFQSGLLKSASRISSPRKFTTLFPYICRVAHLQHRPSWLLAIRPLAQPSVASSKISISQRNRSQSVWLACWPSVHGFHRGSKSASTLGKPVDFLLPYFFSGQFGLNATIQDPFDLRRVRPLLVLVAVSPIPVHMNVFRTLTGVGGGSLLVSSADRPCLGDFRGFVWLGGHGGPKQAILACGHRGRRPAMA